MGGNLRVAVLGAPGVGKTAIIRQFLFGDYPERHQPTNGPRLYRPAVLLDGAVYDLSIRDGDAAGPGHNPESLEVAVPRAKEHVTAWGGVVGILGAHVLVRTDRPRVPTCVRGLKDGCVCPGVCVSQPFSPAWSLTGPGLRPGDFANWLFLTGVNASVFTSLRWWVWISGWQSVVVSP